MEIKGRIINTALAVAFVAEAALGGGCASVNRRERGDIFEVPVEEGGTTLCVAQEDFGIDVRDGNLGVVLQDSTTGERFLTAQEALQKGVAACGFPDEEKARRYAESLEERTEAVAQSEETKRAEETRRAARPAEEPTSLSTETALPTETATPVSEETGNASVVEVVFERPFEVRNNMDVGDRNLWSTVYAEDESGNAFFAVIEKGWNLDFESPMITGQYQGLEGDREDIEDFVNDMAAKLSEGAEEKIQQVYIGEGEAFEGWSEKLDEVDGFTLRENQPFVEEVVLVEDAQWSSPLSRRLEDIDPISSESAWVYGQMWDGTDASVVYHFILQPGYKVSFDGLEGTYWKVEVPKGQEENLQSKFGQMSDEVVERDDEPTIKKIYCGRPGQAPDGWSAVLSEGWHCEEIN